MKTHENFNVYTLRLRTQTSHIGTSQIVTFAVSAVAISKTDDTSKRAFSIFRRHLVFTKRAPNENLFAELTTETLRYVFARGDLDALSSLIVGEIVFQPVLDRRGREMSR